MSYAAQNDEKGSLEQPVTTRIIYVALSLLPEGHLKKNGIQEQVEGQVSRLSWPPVISYNSYDLWVLVLE